MKSKRHFADGWCNNILRKFPSAVSDARELYDNKASYGDAWPDWCGLPMAATYAIITQWADMSNTQKIMTQVGVDALADVTAALLWRKTKACYKFDPTLHKELAKNTRIEKLPVDVFYRLPYHCVFIEGPITTDDTSIKGFFAWMERDANSGIPELRLLFLLQDMNTIPIPIIMTGGKLHVQDSTNALLASAIKNIKASSYQTIGLLTGAATSLDDIFDDVKKAAINLVLYLCSSNAAPELTPIQRPTDKHGDVLHFHRWDVGARFGKAVRAQRAASEQGDGASGTKGSESSRKSSKPHINRCSWNHYWTGPKTGEQELILQWITPTLVSIENDDDAPV